MLNKIDLFNAKNAGTPIEAGLVMDVVAVGTFPDKDKDGHDVTVSVLKCKDGNVYTTISATVSNSIDMLDDIIADKGDDGSAKVKVNQGTSNNGREFYQLQIIE